MSAKREGRRYERPEEVLPFYIEMYMSKMLHTAIPAFVKEYDPSTKRARVQPAIRRERYDTGQTFDRAQLLDVPVVSMSTGGYMLHLPVKVGDLVYVIFSERGIGKFKEAGCEDVADPVRGRFFDQMDGVAIKWGREDIDPVDPDAVCLQSANGNAYITLKDDEVVIKVGDKGVRITGANVKLGRV